jgi:DNA segregation ATPase FtsK/SpoIIIE-like protein
MLLKRLLLAFMLLAPVATHAQDALRHALIIGISTYADPRVPVLEGVPADMESARDIARAMGVPDAEITILRDSEATKQNIALHMGRLGQRTKEGSRVLVYFSGHGTRWQDPAAGGCVEGLLTYDSQAIVNREFAALAQPISMKADKVILMFDACHSGGVGMAPSVNRSWPGGSAVMRPKFFVKADAAPNSCSRPSNMRSRSVLGNSLDRLPENVVQITSSRFDELSFDEAGKGGLATQGVRACMLGGAKDLDGSGAITLGEIEACAQEFVREKVKPWPELLPHHVSVRGLRNLIPVPVALPPLAQVATAAAPAVTPDSARVEREQLQREQTARADSERAESLRAAAQRDEQLRLEQERLAREQSAAEAQRVAEQARAERLAAQRAAREQQAREDAARQREDQERQALAAAALAREREERLLADRERETRDREAREHEASERRAAALARIEQERARREAAARTERERQEAQRAAAQARAEQERLAKLQRELEARERLAREKQAREAQALQLAQERRERQEREEQSRLFQAQLAAARDQAAEPVAAVAALRDLYDQRNRQHTVVARSSRGKLKIGQDSVELTVTSSQPGYLYVVLLGSDETSFYLLFPNGLDQDNRIRARVPVRLPRANWKVQAAGPAGTDRLLVMVTEQPRDLSTFAIAPADAAAPFTYAAADLAGRAKLINFMIGSGARKGSSRFGADWIGIVETP